MIITPIIGKPAADGMWEIEPMLGLPAEASKKLVATQCPTVFVRLRPEADIEQIAGYNAQVASHLSMIRRAGGKLHVGLSFEHKIGAGGLSFEIETSGVDLFFDKSTPVSWAHGFYLLNHHQAWGWLIEEVEAPDGAASPSTADLAKQIKARRMPRPKGA